MQAGSPDRVERRLAAILAADVAGYSRLMGQDEAGTLARLRALRRELIDPQIAEHKGRIVKTTGDGLLVEFPSVVGAVRCAVDVQGSIAERNTSTPAERRIEFRIGIHQGDVLVEEGTFSVTGSTSLPVSKRSPSRAASVFPIVCKMMPWAGSMSPSMTSGRSRSRTSHVRCTSIACGWTRAM